MQSFIDDFKFVLLLGSSPGFHYYSQDGLEALKTNLLSESMNIVIAHSAPSSDQILKIKKYFNAIPFIWWVDEHQAKVVEALQKNGFTSLGKVTAMNMDLAHLPSYMLPHEICIKKVSSAEELKKWSEICAKTSSLPIEVVQQFIDPIYRGVKDVTFYLGYYNDIPVATSTLIRIKNEVNVCNVTVLPDFRRKGLGYAITYMPLKEMCDRGVRRAILQASDMAVSLYAKMGFKIHTFFEGYIPKT